MLAYSHIRLLLLLLLISCIVILFNEAEIRCTNFDWFHCVLLQCLLLYHWVLLWLFLSYYRRRDGEILLVNRYLTVLLRFWTTIITFWILATLITSLLNLFHGLLCFWYDLILIILSRVQQWWSPWSELILSWLLKLLELTMLLDLWADHLICTVVFLSTKRLLVFLQPRLVVLHLLVRVKALIMLSLHPLTQWVDFIFELLLFFPYIWFHLNTSWCWIQEAVVTGMCEGLTSHCCWSKQIWRTSAIWIPLHWNWCLWIKQLLSGC